MTVRPRNLRGADASDGEESGGHILHLPSPRAFLRHALPSLIESTLAPGALFYVVLVLAGFRGALLAAVVWSLLAAARRLWRREQIPGILLLSLALVSVRTVIAYVTGSAFA